MDCEFDPDLVERALAAWIASIPSDTDYRSVWPDDWSPEQQTAMRLGMCAALRESGHAELVDALKTVLYQYALFVGPDDDIANATRGVARNALRKAGAS